MPDPNEPATEQPEPEPTPPPFEPNAPPVRIVEPQPPNEPEGLDVIEESSP